jgi:RNase H-fold protein (predicted Holliday junction resolvase)
VQRDDIALDPREPGSVDVDVPAMGYDAGRPVNAAERAKEAKKIFCGIDPGREKFGLAVCDEEALICAAIVPTADAGAAIDAIGAGNFSGLARWLTEGGATSARADAVFLGDGTGHETFARMLAARGISFSLVDEAMTTLDARAIYRQLHPPKFLWRLLPASLSVPPRPVDDLAAWAIARRGRNRQAAAQALVFF